MKEKRYETLDGDFVSLDRMVRLEPSWAANRIRVCEQLEQEVPKLKKKIKKQEAELGELEAIIQEQD